MAFLLIVFCETKTSFLDEMFADTNLIINVGGVTMSLTFMMTGQQTVFMTNSTSNIRIETF